MRKEYNDRWNSPLVNPAITLGEYEARRTHGWVITKDHIADLSHIAPSNSNAVGLMGPRDLTASQAHIIEHGLRFRMHDDDGILYYEGYVLGDTRAPLYDFGMPNAGCTYIAVNINGNWVPV